MKPILVIDDESVIRAMVEEILIEEGFQVITSENGALGLEQFTRYQPQMVITDIKMPIMDGLQVLERVKKERPETEVIVITGHGEINLAIKALQMEASDFIQKPFGYDALIVAINRAREKIRVRETLAQTQVQLLQAEKMASLGQLAAGIAHEVNNPISFVSSNLGTLKKYTDNIVNAFTQVESLLQNDGSKESLAQFLRLKKEKKIDFILSDMVSIIEESLEGALRVKTIVQDLKEFSRLDVKKLVPTNINDCVNSTLNIAWNELKSKCAVEKHLSEVPLIYCYPQQINQVLLNILLNSAQAIKQDGLVNITTAPESGGVRLEISDNGPGIPPEIIDKIFDPFFTTKDVGEGTGLGLNIAYSIIKKHGGSIEVQSEVGWGTTFILHLLEKPPEYQS